MSTAYTLGLDVAKSKVCFEFAAPNGQPLVRDSATSDADGVHECHNDFLWAAPGGRVLPRNSRTRTVRCAH
jgi:hypothetical protein